MRTAAQAVAQARRYRTNRVGMCLFHVQSWLGAPWSGPYAYWAWQHARHKHPGDKNPPPGVPVYWSGGRYGHIALSVGGGRVRSTDWPRRGHVGECTIDQLSRAWGKRYAGWAADIGGQNIPGVGHPAPRPAPRGGGGTVRGVAYVSKLHYGQRNSDSVKALQRRLIQLGFRIAAGATGNYFGQTDAAVRAWQRKIGDRPDAAGRSSIGPRQAARIFRGTGVTVRR
jgi:hypothetical protein